MREQLNWRPDDSVWRAVGAAATVACQRLPDYEIGSSITFADEADGVRYCRTLTFVPIEQDGLTQLWPAYTMKDGDRQEGYAMISDTEVVHWLDGQASTGGARLMQRFIAQLDWFSQELGTRPKKFDSVENRLHR
jgi:hypothetical protein